MELAEVPNPPAREDLTNVLSLFGFEILQFTGGKLPSNVSLIGGLLLPFTTTANADGSELHPPLLIVHK